LLGLKKEAKVDKTVVKCLDKKILSSIIFNMVHCNSITLFAAIGAAFIGYKVLTLLKTLFDTFVASGISVS
jgi:hypothetical protein